MSDNPPILTLPYIQPAQAQKHVTHNEGMRILDAVAQLSVVSSSVSTPPNAPPVGARYVVGDGGIGDWSGQDGTVAVFDGSGWTFMVPVSGWIAWVEDIGTLRIFDGSDWIALPGLGGANDTLGVNTAADNINRLAVAAQATLLTHDGAGHQLKINKAAAAETASLLFQTDWSGRAEMGTAGSDDFAIKVSADGSTFLTGLSVRATDGIVTFAQGAQSVVTTEAGPNSLVTQAEALKFNETLVRNGLGRLGPAVNIPDGMSLDRITTPDLPACLACVGHYPGRLVLPEPVPVNPNEVYRLRCYVRQEGMPGDWSAYPDEDRHAQSMGIICLDREGLAIEPSMHMRYWNGTTDSLTTLAAPLQPGDMQISLVDAGGWNDSSNNVTRRGVIIFGYKDSYGRPYEAYSRYTERDLFEIAGVDKTNHVITLNKPLPASLGNPDDPDGAWPAGTPIANSNNKSDRYSFFEALVLDETDRWYLSTSYIGGVDWSGTGPDDNFAPGTAAIQLFWLPNETNRSGGFEGAPDTGVSQRVWFAGIDVSRETTARTEVRTTPGAAGSVLVRVLTEAGSTLSYAPAVRSVVPTGPSAL